MPKIHEGRDGKNEHEDGKSNAIKQIKSLEKRIFLR
jgi:hypothetical protein